MLIWHCPCVITRHFDLRFDILTPSSPSHKMTLLRQCHNDLRHSYHCELWYFDTVTATLYISRERMPVWQCHCDITWCSHFVLWYVDTITVISSPSHKITSLRQWHYDITNHISFNITYLVSHYLWIYYDIIWYYFQNNDCFSLCVIMY